MEPRTGRRAPRLRRRGKKVTIDRLLVQKAKLNVSAAVLKGETVRLSIPDIELKDIGKESQGASLATVVEMVLKEVNRNAAQAVAKVDLKGMAEKARKEAEEAVQKEVEGATGEVGKKLKGVFGK